METIKNFDSSPEEFQVIHPTIHYPLLILESLGISTVIGLIIALALIDEQNISMILWIFFGVVFGIVFLKISMQKAALTDTEYKFFSNRLEYSEGFLVKNRKTISYTHISNVSQKRRILERLFGLGTIYIDTAGSSRDGNELYLKYIREPDRVYDWIAYISAKQK